jgi:iduronate 2-sulfatase
MISTIILSLLTLLAAGSVSLAVAAPNVLLICVDDLKPALGCYGDSQAKTPHLDRLAARGMRFDHAYCNQAVCAPSRNTLMTGLRPQTIGIYDLSTHFRQAVPEAVTIGQHFKRHGYRVESLGKIFHVGHGNRDDASSWSVASWRPQGGGYAIEASAANPRPGKSGPKGAAYESADVPDSRYADGMIAEEAIQRLRAAAARREQPFFLAVGFLKPHLPFVAPKRYWDLFERDAFSLAQLQQPPLNAPGYAPQFGGELRNYKDIPTKGTLPDDLQRTLIHGYYAATSFMDAQAGRILTELETLGLADNTLVVLWGDHGWHLGDHGIWCKHTNYEQAARIPLLCAGPSIAAGHSAALVETADLYPTLAELAGLPPPDRIDGLSFAATARDAQVPHRDHVIHVYPRSRPGVGSVLGRAVRTAHHRIVEWKQPGASPETAEYELYDYRADPAETANLADSQPAVVARLRGLLATHPEARPQLKTRPSAEGQPSRPKASRKPDAEARRG